MPTPKFSIDEHVLVEDEDGLEEARVLERRERMLDGDRLSYFYKLEPLDGSVRVRWVHEKDLEKCPEDMPRSPSLYPQMKYSGDMPEQIKLLLRRDFIEMQKSNGSPVQFKLSVASIVKLFVKYLRETRPSAHEEVKEIEKAFMEFFVFALDRFCLYDCERLYYEENVRPRGADATLEAYGAVHLLRVLVSFPKIRAKLALEQDISQFMCEYIRIFFGFILRNLNAL